MKMWIDDKPTVKIDLKYKCQMVECTIDEARFMYVRTQYFVFRIDQAHLDADVSKDFVKTIQIEIPSFSEGDEIRPSEWKNKEYQAMMKNHLLNKIERRITTHVESEIMIAGLKDNYPHWQFNFIEEKI